MKHFAAAVSIVLLLSSSAFPAFFTWTDRNGTAHFTDDISRIPPGYRKQAVHLQGFDDNSPASAPARHAAAKGTPPAASGEDGPAAQDGAGTAGQRSAGKRKSAPEDDGSRVGALARTLLKDGQSDRDKAYAAFCWIRANISYDNYTKWQRRYGSSGANQSPDAVIASGRGVCAGMANLFTALAQRMGLESVVVTGRASGARQERHAWNAVKIDGKWGLVDITRHTFLAPPEEFLARHFPDNPRWQLLDKPLTYEEWLQR